MADRGIEAFKEAASTPAHRRTPDQIEMMQTARDQGMVEVTNIAHQTAQDVSNGVRK